MSREINRHERRYKKAVTKSKTLTAWIIEADDHLGGKRDYSKRLVEEISRVLKSEAIEVMHLGRIHLHPGTARSGQPINKSGMNEKRLVKGDTKRN